MDSVPLTLGTGSLDSNHDHAVVVVRPNKPRRYKLLSKDRLKIPNGFSKRYDYTKHMPLITVNTDEDEESEEFDSRVFRKVSNRNLRELLNHDRTRHGPDVKRTPDTSPDAQDEDDWDLTLTLPTAIQSRKCGCLPLPECSIS